MGFFNPNHDVDERKSSLLEPANADSLAREAMQVFDFSTHLEKLALFLAHTWKDEHPDATAHSEDGMDDCILAVTMELAIAAKAVRGPIGLAILTGGGSAASRAACRQVCSDDSD